MVEIIIKRTAFYKTQTIGTLTVTDTLSDQVLFKCHTLELPWRNNQSNISCIPAGDYLVYPRTSPKFSNHFILEGTGKRRFILIHSGNYVKDTEGCILVGKNVVDLNKDGVPDITDSKATLSRLLALVKEPSLITIVEDDR